MFTPERKCDVRQLDAQTYAVCASSREAVLRRARERTTAAVNSGDVAAFTELIRRASRAWDEVDPVTPEHAASIASLLLGAA